MDSAAELAEGTEDAERGAEDSEVEAARDNADVVIDVAGMEDAVLSAETEYPCTASVTHPHTYPYPRAVSARLQAFDTLVPIQIW